MLRPSQSIREGDTLDCDVCIIGAGPAGITLARALQERSIGVILLEAGGSSIDPEVQALYDGEVLDPAHPPIQMYRQRRLGGSSAIWGGRCVPLDPLDFRPRRHVPLSGWPFTRRTLDPYYEAAQKLVEVGEYDYSAASALCGRPFIAGFSHADVLTDNLERYSPPTDFWKRYSAGFRSSPLVTVVSHAPCIRLVAAANGQSVTVAQCVNRRDQRFLVRARRFVVAAGGLETVRLLAFSGLGTASGWLGRTYMCHIEATIGRLRLSPAERPIVHGFERTPDGVYVRRRFTLAPERQEELGLLNAAVRLHHPNIVDPGHRHPVLSTMFLAKKFILPEYARNFSVVDMPEYSRKFSQVNNAPAVLSAVEHRGFMLAHLRNVAAGLPTLLAFASHWFLHRRLFGRRMPYVALHDPTGSYALNFYGEQAPDPSSRVTLGGELDRHGVPRLRIDWKASELDLRTVSGTLRELRRGMIESKCGTVEFDEDGLEQEVRSSAVPVGGHHIGTARMSVDRSSGVVDGDGRIHDLDNVYVAGSATFPTSGQANPTLTIVAMALRLADHLVSTLAS